MASHFPSIKFLAIVCLLSVFGVSAETTIRFRNLRNRPMDTEYQEEIINAGNELDYLDYDMFDIESTLPDSNSEKHPCQRPCKEGETMTCKYKFVVEYYSTMSRACYNCPRNISDCFLKQCVPADGVLRTILAVNRQLPGPTIDVCYGDSIEVDMINNMLDLSTTIHWHGLHQTETPHMDGVPFVSQCPVEPRGSFHYKFIADQPGTHFWHSHSALQRGDGIYGPLIVREPIENDPHSSLYDFDLPEHVIITLDWNHELGVVKFMSHYLAGSNNKPDSILINGKGRFNEFLIDGNITFTPAEKFTVKAGKKYRFRLINAGFLNCPVEMTIDNHTITVIASDGDNIKPIETDTLISVPGERFDFILEANQEIDNYWMRFRGIMDGEVKKAFQVAVLHYEGADENEDPDGDVTYESSISRGFKVNGVNTKGTDNILTINKLESLKTSDDPALKPIPDVKFFLPFDFYPVENIHYRYPTHPLLSRKMSSTPQINHISMQFPNFPLMADAFQRKNLEFCNVSTVSMECRFKFCECPHVLNVPLNAVVELILIDEGLPFNANHPFHLHGYKFSVVAMDRLGNSTTEEQVRRLDGNGKIKRNLKNPPLKDTITIPDGGYAVVRFHATNPGLWILHCHIDFHVEMGMALLLKVGEDSDFVQPPQNFPTCGQNTQTLNQSELPRAKFFPNKGIGNGSLLSVSKISQLQIFSVVAFVLFLSTFNL